MKKKNIKKAFIILSRHERKIIKTKFPGSPEYELAKDKIVFIKNNKTIFDQIDWSKIIVAERPDEKKPKKKYFSIQISSVTNKRFANAWRIRLKSNGFPAFSKTAKTDKGLFFRTYVGKYKTKDRALNIKNQIEHKFKLKCLVVELEE